MAFTTTVTRRGDVYRVLIEETVVRDTSVATITGADGLTCTIGRVLRQKCLLQAGTGTTVDPMLSRTTLGVGLGIIVENDVAAAVVDNAGDAPWFASETDATGATLYHHSNVNSAVPDHTITSEYILIADFQ